jgi:hypothetical protein
MVGTTQRRTNRVARNNTDAWHVVCRRAEEVSEVGIYLLKAPQLYLEGLETGILLQ